MGLVGFRCPKGSKTEGTNNRNADACFNQCDRQCLAEPLLHAIWSSNAGYKPSFDPTEAVTITRLVGCHTQHGLSRLVDYFDTPKNLYYSIRGKIFHRLMEDYQNGILERGLDPSDFRIEERWGPRMLGDVPIGGRIDLHINSANTRYSWKTIGDKGLEYLKDGPKQDHVLQENFYSWLNPEVKTSRIVIVYMSMMETVETGGLFTVTKYQKSQPKDISENHPALKQWNQNGYKWTLIYQIPDCPVFKPALLEKTIGGIYPQAKLLWRIQNGRIDLRTAPESSELTNLAYDPGSIGEKNEGWRCRDYCPEEIKNKCKLYHPENQHNVPENQQNEL